MYFIFTVLTLCVGMQYRPTQGLSTTNHVQTETLINAYVGQLNVELNCIATTNRESRLSWYMEDKKSEFLLTRDNWIQYPSSYDVGEHTIGKNQSNYRLIVKTMNKLYEGLYRCQATRINTRSRSDDDDITVVLGLTRLLAFEISPEPNVEIDILDNYKNVTEGKISIVKCMASVGTIPVIFKISISYRNSTKFDITNSTYNQCGFNCVTVEVNITRNMDSFQCVALHDLLASPIINHTKHLDVRYKPTFQNMPKTKYDTEGNLEIMINVDSNPKAWIDWYLWLADITTSLKNATLENSSALLIKESEMGNATHIEIKAINNIGYDTRCLQLDKYSKESEKEGNTYWWCFFFVGLSALVLALLIKWRLQKKTITIETIYYREIPINSTSGAMKGAFTPRSCSNLSFLNP